MKKCFLAAMVALSFVAWPCNGETNAWYHLWKGQTYITDFVLNPGTSTNIIIKTEKNTMVSFLSDATQAEVKEYHMNSPITIEQMNPKKPCQPSFSSVQGGGIDFDPVNGEIKIKISNT